jgi:hypothetical protein
MRLRLRRIPDISLGKTLSLRRVRRAASSTIKFASKPTDRTELADHGFRGSAQSFPSGEITNNGKCQKRRPGCFSSWVRRSFQPLHQLFGAAVETFAPRRTRNSAHLARVSPTINNRPTKLVDDTESAEGCVLGVPTETMRR